MENQENAIEIRNVSKAFKIFKDKPLTLKEKILKLRSDSYTMFYALKDVSASIKRGESIGLIGHKALFRTDQSSTSVRNQITFFVYYPFAVFALRQNYVFIGNFFLFPFTGDRINNFPEGPHFFLNF